MGERGAGWSQNSHSDPGDRGNLPLSAAKEKKRKSSHQKGPSRKGLFRWVKKKWLAIKGGKVTHELCRVSRDFGLAPRVSSHEQ